MIKEAINALKRGEFVLVFDSDSRERETDFVIGAEFVNWEHIKTMRKDGGGLICLAVDYSFAEKLGLPFLTDVLSYSSKRFEAFELLKPNDIPYDEKSSFSITINHRKTFTGISDRDRALTIRSFAELCKNGCDKDEFGRNFRSPGHVPLLIGARNLVYERKGHTELSLALARLAGITPVTAICEMLGNDGYSLSYEDAKRYARDMNIVFVEGKEIINAYKNVIKVVR